jgi:signal transduction histidine kinase
MGDGHERETLWALTHAGSVEDVTALQARYDACVKARDALQAEVVALLAERDRLAQALHDRD